MGSFEDTIKDIAEKGGFLSKEMWEAALNGLTATAPIFEKFFKAMDFEGKGAVHAAIYMRDIHMAICAMRYVADHARDKVRFVQLNDDDYAKAEEYIKNMIGERIDS